MARELEDNMRFRTSCFMLGLTFGLAGCVETPPASKDVAPLPISVSFPTEQYVTDYTDHTARTAAVDSVEVRAHVWGYLDKVNFTEGALVKKGDVLFELDPRPYVALLNQAKAKVRQDEALLRYDEAEYQRNVQRPSRAVSAHVWRARSRRPACSSSERRRFGALATPAASS